MTVTSLMCGCRCLHRQREIFGRSPSSSTICSPVLGWEFRSSLLSNLLRSFHSPTMSRLVVFVLEVVLVLALQRNHGAPSVHGRSLGERRKAFCEILGPPSKTPGIFLEDSHPLVLDLPSPNLRSLRSQTKAPDVPHKVSILLVVGDTF